MLTPSTVDLAGAARADYFAYAALASLSPFVFKPVSNIDDTAMTAAFGASYVAWQADRDAVASGKSPIAITDQWLTDRANFLDRKNWFNDKNTNPENTAYQPNQADHPYLKDSTYLYFEDVASGYRIQQGLLDYSTRIYAFGDERANTFAGKGVADHLYGGGGNDTLIGDYGDDYLEGGTGIDELKRRRRRRHPLRRQGGRHSRRWCR
jgi:Ca2+-binding RTX toxin-like protein